MENPNLLQPEQKFSSPEEELAYLRNQVAVRERELMARGAEVTRDEVISDKVKDYSYAPTQAVLHETHKAPDTYIEDLALNLAPETHDYKIIELVKILKEKGIKNAMDVVAEMNDPHVEDDFHRFLVQYVKKGLVIDGLKPKSELFRELNMTLYEVSLPDSKDQENKSIKELVSSMEQFYSGMMAIEDRDDSGRYFSIEIANPNHSEEFIVYVSVPDTKKNLFEKQILSLFPLAKIKEIPDDYNIFNEAGATVGSVAEFDSHAALPIKTYETFDHDPMNVVLNTFSKIKKDGEGAAIQFIIRPPVADEYVKQYKMTLEQVQKGTKLKDALPKSIAKEVFGSFKDVFFGSKKDEDKDTSKTVDENAVEQLKNKISSPIAEVNIRIIASAPTISDADKIISDIESSFRQVENTQGNKLIFKRQSGKKLIAMAKDFSYRAFTSDHLLPINFKELTTLFHFPGSTIKSSPQLKQSMAASAPAPMDMPQDGTLLGVNRFRNVETKVFMTKEDRLRHMYVIGQTGTGKSTILKNMIAQDILQGEGVCMIDPHGVDILDILSIIPPERYEDIIYFDPSDTKRPMSLNMLEYDRRYPEQKTFVVNEMMSIFNKLFDMKTSGGPMFEQYFRNATMLVIEDPDTGSTLLDVSRVLADKAYRQLKIARCKNPIVVQFWKEIAEKAGGEASLGNIVPYITSKFDVFLSNDIMRPIVSQEQSSFNFRELMDTKKILLVNLAKGRLGDINANLIGLIIVGKILMAALSRADSLHLNPAPFYLYIDEFQNVTTDSISTILSEARKYKLSLNVAHQFIAQLDEGIRDSVFGNVGNMAVYRVGADDAEFLEKQFAPEFTAKDIMNIENYHAYLKILVRGKPVKPFDIKAQASPQGKKDHLEKLKELSGLKYGRDRADVEADIMLKYKKPDPVPPVAPAAATKL
ncbi:MAG: DUF87 domain-containing protein [Patescibacteria group bacterium]